MAVSSVVLGALIVPYALKRSREKLLQQDLVMLRAAIDQYTLDKQRAPQSLGDLVSADYLKQLPEDPMTHSRDTWSTVKEDTPTAINPQHPGIVDVHSGSKARSSKGDLYSDW
jgi:general secretion pathway protein G